MESHLELRIQENHWIRWHQLFQHPGSPFAALNGSPMKTLFRLELYTADLLLAQWTQFDVGRIRPVPGAGEISWNMSLSGKLIIGIHIKDQVHHEPRSCSQWSWPSISRYPDFFNSKYVFRSGPVTKATLAPLSVSIVKNRCYMVINPAKSDAVLLVGYSRELGTPFTI